MKISKNVWTGMIAGLGLIALILDTKICLSGAKDGVILCINTVIPSLFPFFVLSSVVNSTFTGLNLKFLRPLGRICRIPEGSEPLLILGLLGGYPVGAQSIAEACRSGCLDKKNARRMLGFCNNAGPAFIFGMLSGLFASQAAAWCLWLIHILSAIIVGVVLPDTGIGYCRSQKRDRLTFSAAVESSIKTMARVCAWIVIFRVILIFFQKWFTWLLPGWAQIAFVGFLELSNGCIALYSLQNQGLRYILSAAFLGFGGLCVWLQTASVTGFVGTGHFIEGKLLQLLISLALALITQYFLFSENDIIALPWLPVAIIVLLFALHSLHKKKKVVAIPG